MLFIVSACVTIFGAIYNWWQANAYQAAYADRFSEIVGAGSAADRRTDPAPESAQGTLPSGVTPQTIRAWVDRAADSSANFPATILTVVALQEIERFSSVHAQIALLLGAVLFAMAFMIRVGPNYANGRTFLKLSVWSLVLVAVNVLAFVFTELT